MAYKDEGCAKQAEMPTPRLGDDVGCLAPGAQGGEPIGLGLPGMGGLSANIRKVANGFIVEIGCQTFVSKDWTEVSLGLAEYWENPEKARRKYCK